MRKEKHINRFGELRPRFLKRLIESKVERNPIIGYCQLQGDYLAAREYNQLEVFNEVKKKYSKNVIPNF